MEAVAQTPSELAGSVLRPGSENGQVVRHAPPAARDDARLSRSGPHFCERAAPFPRRLYATASPGSGHLRRPHETPAREKGRASLLERSSLLRVAQCRRGGPSAPGSPCSGHETASWRVAVRGRPYGRATGIGAFWENVVGQAVLDDGLRARACSVAAPATCPVALRARIRRCRLPAGSPAVVNDAEEDEVRDAREGDRVGRAPASSARSRSPRTVRCARRAGSQTTPEQLELFAQSLGADDRVALEVTGSAWEIARILEPHVARVVVVSRRPTRASARRGRRPTGSTRARWRRLLCGRRARRGLDAGSSRRRVLRRRLARREQLVRARSRAKNEIHAVLDAPAEGQARPSSDLFGVKGAQVAAPGSSCRSRRQRRSRRCLRHVEFLDREIAAVERADRPSRRSSPRRCAG